MAAQAGFEPATNWLTANCSTTELLSNLFQWKGRNKGAPSGLVNGFLARFLNWTKPWHQDSAYFSVTPLDAVCGVWIAIDEATMHWMTCPGRLNLWSKSSADLTVNSVRALSFPSESEKMIG